jgi:nucleotide-binding universal stress UspA family protein
MVAPKNILVATDFSDCSKAALEYGRALAHVFHARLHVMHVVEVFAIDSVAFGTAAATIPMVQAELERSAHATLNALLTADDRRDLRAVAEVRTIDTPAHAISQYAEEEKIDLVIVGTHGRKGLSHVLLGSVAEKVVRLAPCPVLTVRYPQKKSKEAA